MCDALIISGAVIEAFGLVLVFVELAVIRSHELGVPAPWTRLAGRLRRFFRGTRVTHVVGTAGAKAGASLRLSVKRGTLPADATDTQRIERLEARMDDMDARVDGVNEEMDRRTRDAGEALERRAKELADAMAERDEARRAALRPSLRLQGVGALCVLVGLGLGTWGNLC
jgi:hypothetical protein